MAVMHDAFEPRYGEAWTRKQVSDALITPNTHYLIAGGSAQHVVPEDAKGFVLSRRAADEEELLLIAVRPQFRGQGVGRRLLEEFATRAAANGVTRLFLEMREGNPAEHLYTQFGFARVGTRRGYYRGAVGGPIDAITFAREV
ncbi:GNAT family N-acetyltransferase [Aurantiacibacter aquimixticola]|uniref:GNAT family N-acetyltransferase n=2 Tax=Aurantiacibacter aquimixticola TaxID=1958945 RepID=A0A419RWC0_9SPHN|nr:GNAT family N-acetyltransferase [Aurantiacibacter aquimixticola]